MMTHHQNFTSQISPRTVSIIIPIWNGENYLEEAVESALSQDYADREIIAVDDGSTDRTQQILQKYKKSIRILRQENRGLGASRNSGVRIANGQFFAFLDHDDLWSPNKLRLQMQALFESDVEDPLIFTHMEQFICPTLSSEERAKIAVDTSSTPSFLAGTLLLSRERFFEVGLFQEKKQLGEFVEWYLRALEKKVPMLLMNQTLFYRRVHKENMGRRDAANRSDYLKIIQASLMRKRQKLEVDAL